MKVKYTANGGITPAHGFPALWSVHFLHYCTKLIPTLTTRIIEQFKASNGKYVGPDTSHGFFLPRNDEWAQAHKRRFTAELQHIWAPYTDSLSVGCPKELFNLLLRGFQYLEQDACERFRYSREAPPQYDHTDLDPNVLDFYFEGKCTKPLSNVSQVVWFCLNQRRFVCRTALQRFLAFP